MNRVPRVKLNGVGFKLPICSEFVNGEPTRVFVIPAEAGIQAVFEYGPKRTWMPACAGMTTVALSDGEKTPRY